MERSEHSVLRHIQTIFESGTVGDLTDRQLLERFVGRDRDMAELSFAALVERHGPMVLRTCRSILQNRHDAEDAFQATFLVLSRKARSLWIRDSLGPWLFQVARRVAGCARTEALGRLNREREAAKRSSESATETATWDDQGAVVCEELGRLPDRYRAAVVLCDLEGLTQERAAELLGLPAGTVRQSAGASARAAAQAIDAPWIGSRAVRRIARAHWSCGRAGGAGRTCRNHHSRRRRAHHAARDDGLFGFHWCINGRSAERHVLEQSEAGVWRRTRGWFGGRNRAAGFVAGG